MRIQRCRYTVTNTYPTHLSKQTPYLPVEQRHNPLWCIYSCTLSACCSKQPPPLPTLAGRWSQGQWGPERAWRGPWRGRRRGRGSLCCAKCVFLSPFLSRLMSLSLSLTCECYGRGKGVGYTLTVAENCSAAGAPWPWAAE